MNASPSSHADNPSAILLALVPKHTPILRWSPLPSRGPGLSSSSRAPSFVLTTGRGGFERSQSQLCPAIPLSSLLAVWANAWLVALGALALWV